MIATSDEQLSLVSAVREFAEAELAPHSAEWDRTKHFALDALERAGELGLGGVYVGEEHGGSELGRADAVLIFEELAKGDVAIAAYISIHNMVAWMIDRFASDEVRAEWVPGLAALTSRGAYCLTEPGAGSDAAALTTRAVRDGDDWVLTGVKQFISGAGAADVYVVMARTGGPGAKGISAFVVPAGTEGLSFGSNEVKMGWNAQPTRQVILDGVRVPGRYLLEGEGSGFGIAMQGLNGGRLSIAACSLGGAQWALDRTVAYVQERETFGSPLADHQSVLFTLAEMDIRMHAARALLHDAARALDHDAANAVALCAMAKNFATDAGFAVADQALQLHGGYGYLAEYGIEKVVRDLRVHRILEGSNEIMKLIVGRALLEAGS